MLRKSAKFKLPPGVWRPSPENGPLPPPGVDIMEDGRGVIFCGGVEGGMTCVLFPPLAEEGDVAKYMSRLASSWPL